MLIGLAAPLDEGMRIPVSLFFERAGMIEATFDRKRRREGAATEIAAASQASAARTPALKSDAVGPFFTHICGTRVMANVARFPRGSAGRWRSWCSWKTPTRSRSRPRRCG